MPDVLIGIPDTPTPSPLIAPIITATVIADSLSEEGVRLTTLELVYPRFIHSEFMTHKMFSKNAASSRAIPTKRLIKMIRDTPAVPASWRMNEPGMQGHTVASDLVAHAAQQIWMRALESAIDYAMQMDALGIHKQNVNRLMEPFVHMKTLMTGVYFDNFLGLRDHEAADPTIQPLAQAVKAARVASRPALLSRGDWHLPYISAQEFATIGLAQAQKVSVARAARTSYNNVDGTQSSLESDLALYERLVGTQPIHASPAEHQATPDWKGAHSQWMNPHRHANLASWQQLRKFLPGENLDTVV